MTPYLLPVFDTSLMNFVGVINYYDNLHKDLIRFDHERYTRDKSYLGVMCNYFFDIYQFSKSVIAVGIFLDNSLPLPKIKHGGFCNFVTTCELDKLVHDLEERTLSRFIKTADLRSNPYLAPVYLNNSTHKALLVGFFEMTGFTNTYVSRIGLTEASTVKLAKALKDNLPVNCDPKFCTIKKSDDPYKALFSTSVKSVFGDDNSKSPQDEFMAKEYDNSPHSTLIGIECSDLQFLQQRKDFKPFYSIR